MCERPFSDASASLLEAADGEVDWLCRGIVCWKVAARFGGFAYHPIEAFDGIGGVNYLSNGWRESEERNDFLPCPPPAWGD
jgi:hypothetical protein